MQLLVADQEGGLTGDEAALWLDRWQILVRTKAPGAHAQIVERHHDVLRRLLLRMESQLAGDGVMSILDEAVVAECRLAKNFLVSVGGVNPDQALYGRTPPIVADFEPASGLPLDDSGAGIAGSSRHQHRLWEIPVQSMVDLTARQRVERAARAKTRRTTESLELQAGDQIEFHRPADGEGLPPWLQLSQGRPRSDGKAATCKCARRACEEHWCYLRRWRSQQWNGLDPRRLRL